MFQPLSTSHRYTHYNLSCDMETVFLLTLWFNVIVGTYVAIHVYSVTGEIHMWTELSGSFMHPM